jgi:hypothetical protein
MHLNSSVKSRAAGETALKSGAFIDAIVTVYCSSGEQVSI